jgi:hypothetical protein
LADLEPVIYTKLSGNAGVLAQVSTRIYPVQGPQGGSRPLIVYSKVSDNPINNAAPAFASESNARVRFHAIAETYAGAKAVAAAIRSALDGWRDTGTSPKVQSALPIGEYDATEYQSDGTVQAIHVVSLDYSIWFSA